METCKSTEHDCSDSIIHNISNNTNSNSTNLNNLDDTNLYNLNISNMNLSEDPSIHKSLPTMADGASFRGQAGENNNDQRLLNEMTNTRGFKIAALNINSLPAHIDELKAYMCSGCIDILAVNETRLDQSFPNNLVSIPGYNLERRDRNRNGGGIAFYIRDAINYELMHELAQDPLEWLCIKVQKPKSKPFIVGTWYRPPSSTTDIMNNLELLIKKLEVLDIEINIIGDFNFDVGASPPNAPTKHFLDLCNLYQYHQLIKEPTRITERSSTTIDLFITNNPTMYVKSGVCHIGISDHSLVYAIRKLCVPRKDPRIIRSRQFRDFNANSFRHDLSLAPWYIIEEYENDPNLAWEAWKTIFLKISDIHAPKRSRKIRNKHSPWLTPELKKLMFERDRLKRIASKHDTEHNWSKYRSARNNVSRCIQDAKAAYYHNYFRNSFGDIKNTWKGVNELMGKNSHTNVISSIKVGECNYTSSRDISNAFNNHFTQIGPKLVNNVPTSNSNFEQYIITTDNNFSITETNNTIVYNLIQSLPVNKSTGLDEISCKLLIEASPIVSSSLTHIINLSIRNGVFPNDWKRARVIPIYKEDTKSDPDNYRPISILPIVSKIIEKIVFSQFYGYLIDNNLLSSSQHGFRPLHSTLTTLLISTNNWYQKKLIKGYLMEFYY